MSADQGKKAAAFACGAACLKSNQKIGVGSGTTVKYLIDYIKEQTEQGKLSNIVCVPTSFLVRLVFWFCCLERVLTIVMGNIK